MYAFFELSRTVAINVSPAQKFCPFAPWHYHNKKTLVNVANVSLNEIRLGPSYPVRSSFNVAIVFELVLSPFQIIIYLIFYLSLITPLIQKII